MATGEAHAGPSSFLFFLQRKDTSHPEPLDLPNDPNTLQPSPVEKASSVSAVCGNDSSFTNKTDHSVTDGINSEHKQEQRQSAKDAGSSR